eukprot:3692787-Prymnesium_polylepis.1
MQSGSAAALPTDGAPPRPSRAASDGDRSSGSGCASAESPTERGGSGSKCGCALSQRTRAPTPAQQRARGAKPGANGASDSTTSSSHLPPPTNV